MKTSYNFIFVGGGLANCLAAWRLSSSYPDKSFLIIEAGDSLGGNHTWSFHENDLTEDQLEWILPLVSKTWSGYNVRFPNFSRPFFSRYFSVRSSLLNDVIGRHPGVNTRLKTTVRELFADGVVIEGGEKIGADVVFDGRGWDADVKMPMGYQKFVGQDLTLEEPHGLERPVLMDATIQQKDGFRFIYLLPWSDRGLLVEDTRYSESAILDVLDLREEIKDYARQKKWRVISVDREEVGLLPIPMEGNLPAWSEGIVKTGVRSGLFHATTGYSLPHATRFADELVASPSLERASLFSWARTRAAKQWEHGRFFRLLNRMMFRAASPDDRYKILEQFYRRSDGLVSRFYAGRLNVLDYARILTGRPPVPVGKALGCLRER